MYRPPHGVHVPPVQRHSARSRSAMPQGVRPQVVRPRGSHAQRGSGHDQDDFGPPWRWLWLLPPSGPCFPHGDRS
jgi:hypothetical protein